jgi:opacity protein-like surface antigen
MQRSGWRRAAAGAAFCAAAIAAHGGIGGWYGTWDTEYAGAGEGYGARLRFSLTDPVLVELRGGYFENFDGDDDKERMIVVPLEIGLFVRGALGERLSFVAGGGAGFYVIPPYEQTTPIGRSGEPDIDPEDSGGWFAAGGLEFALTESIAVFAEVRHTWVEVDLVRIDGEETANSGTSLDGLGFAVGLMLWW